MATGGILLRRIRATVSDVPTGFVWVEKDKLAASGYPASRAQLRWLSRKGVRSVLTLTESPLPAKWLDGLSMETKHIAMRDHMPPELPSLDQAADYIEAQVDAGKPVLVHCQAGRGRTMCALAAYLIKDRGMRADEAMAHLRRIRPEAVEHGQEQSLIAYEAALKKTGKKRE